MRAAELRAIDLQKAGHGEQLILDRFGQLVVFSVERIMVGHRPRHVSYIAPELLFVYSL